MRFQKLDLNLLVVLDALLQDRSVSMAANRLNLSQSATSSALGRLRMYFEDDLLVLKGRTMVLTPRAEELAEPVRGIMEGIRTTIDRAQPFDPRESDRVLKIMASDYAIAVLLHELMCQLPAEAPGMRFEIWPLGDGVIEELQRGRLDLSVAIDTAISTEHPHQQLWEDDFVVVGWAENPLLHEPMTKALYESLSHVTVRFGWERVPSFEEWALRSHHVHRNIEIVAPGFVAAATFVVGSHRIATLHRRLAAKLMRTMPLVIRECPFPIPRVRQTVQWARSSASDPAILWMVRRMVEQAEQLDARITEPVF